MHLSKWRPISEAPSNQDLLLWAGPNQHVGRIEPITQRAVMMRQDGGYSLLPGGDATLWQPLPDPPSDSR